MPVSASPMPASLVRTSFARPFLASARACLSRVRLASAHLVHTRARFPRIRLASARLGHVRLVASAPMSAPATSLWPATLTSTPVARRRAYPRSVEGPEVRLWIELKLRVELKSSTELKSCRN